MDEFILSKRMLFRDDDAEHSSVTEQYIRCKIDIMSRQQRVLLVMLANTSGGHMTACTC